MPSLTKPPPQLDWPSGHLPQALHMLFSGAVGVAVARIEAARQGIVSEDYAMSLVSRILEQPLNSHPEHSGLGVGAPAVGFLLTCFPSGYCDDLLSQIDGHVYETINHRLAAASLRIERGQLPRSSEFDLISGLTGFGVYLLRRRTNDDLLRQILEYLGLLIQPVTLLGTKVPGWWETGGPGGDNASRWAEGHANMGLAHGIAGPLALLAISMRSNIAVPTAETTIRSICAAYDRCATGSGWATHWPSMLTWRRHREGCLGPDAPSRPSWCYGTPGIARSLQLAGLAIGDNDRVLLAQRSMAGSLAQGAQTRLLTDSSLCHGWTGVRLTLRHMLSEAIPDASCVPTTITAFADLTDLHVAALQVDRAAANRKQTEKDEGANLLTGRCGVWLGSHAAAALTSSLTQWESCLLLTG